MKFTPIAVAIAALFSFGAIAQDKPKQESTQATPPAPAAGTPAPAASTPAPAAPSAEQKSEKSAAAGGGQKSSQSPEVVKEVQEKLSKAGHDAGDADGKMGPKLQAALKKYQESKGINATGEIDQPTLSALGVKGGSAAGGASDAPKAESKTGGAAATGGTAEPKAEKPAKEEPKDKAK